MLDFIHTYCDYLDSLSLACGDGEYRETDIGIKLLPGCTVLCGCVCAFQDTSTVHAPLCIPVSKLASCTFSTIPACPIFFNVVAGA